MKFFNAILSVITLSAIAASPAAALSERFDRAHEQNLDKASGRFDEAHEQNLDKASGRFDEAHEQNLDKLSERFDEARQQNLDKGIAIQM